MGILISKSQRSRSLNPKMNSVQILAMFQFILLGTSSDVPTKDVDSVGSNVEEVMTVVLINPKLEEIKASEQLQRMGRKVDESNSDLGSGDKSEQPAKPDTYIASIGSKYCPKPDGRNQFQNSCHRFVICSNGQLSQFGQCPTGQVFEPAISNCMDIGRASRRDCSDNQRGGRTAAIQRYCRQALDKLTSHGLTPRFGDRDLFALPADPCFKFVTRAVDGHFQIGSCPRGTAFAPRLRKCLPKRKVRNPKCQN